jgi:hypothetical protein
MSRTPARTVGSYVMLARSVASDTTAEMMPGVARRADSIDATQEPHLSEMNAVRLSARLAA